MNASLRKQPSSVNAPLHFSREENCVTRRDGNKCTSNLHNSLPLVSLTRCNLLLQERTSLRRTETELRCTNSDYMDVCTHLLGDTRARSCSRSYCFSKDVALISRFLLRWQFSRVLSATAAHRRCFVSAFLTSTVRLTERRSLIRFSIMHEGESASR